MVFGRIISYILRLDRMLLAALEYIFVSMLANCIFPLITVYTLARYCR